MAIEEFNWMRNLARIKAGYRSGSSVRNYTDIVSTPTATFDTIQREVTDTIMAKPTVVAPKPLDVWNSRRANGN